VACAVCVDVRTCALEAAISGVLWRSLAFSDVLLPADDAQRRHQHQPSAVPLRQLLREVPSLGQRVQGVSVFFRCVGGVHVQGQEGSADMWAVCAAQVLHPHDQGVRLERC
jgi:hypothetical protein